MSAFDNFMGAFFPNVLRRRQQEMMNDRVNQALQGLIPFADQEVNRPYQLSEMESYGSEDPINQLQPMDLREQFTNKGLFNMDQAKGLAQFLANPKTAGFGQALFNQINSRGDQYTLNPGQIRYDQNGNVIAQNVSDTLDQVDPVQSSNIMEDGTTQIVRRSGKVEVIRPGANDVQAIKDAQTFGAEMQGIRSGQRASGSQAIAQSGKAFEKLALVRTNIDNLNEGVRLIDAGANTGVIVSKLPSVQTASQELDNLQARLGLDVIGNTTFGALSDNELKFALSASLPKDLKPAALKDWLIRKRDAQEKLANYLQEATIYLGTPGNSVAGFLAMKKAQSKGGKRIEEMTDEELKAIMEGR